MPALAKRILNPDNKWLWIAGGAVVLGGTWWYLSRKEEDAVKKAPKNLFDISDRAEAQKIAAERIDGKVLTVWMRNGEADVEVLKYLKPLAAKNKDVKFYFFREDTFGHLWSDKTGVVVGAAAGNQRKAKSRWGLSDKVGDAKKGIDRAMPYLTDEKKGTVPGPPPNTIGDVLPLPEPE